MYLPPPQVVCIAQVVYAEARDESERGQRAVVHVILNRSAKFNQTPCEVISQPGQFAIKKIHHYSAREWDRVRSIVLTAGKDPTCGALFYKTRTCRVRWRYRYTTSIGNHNFYK